MRKIRVDHRNEPSTFNERFRVSPSHFFFGASGDLNTARQAKRLVGTYNKLRDRDVKFIVINVDKPANKEAEDLIKKYYKGYIPCQTVIDSDGTTTWSKVGEVSENEVTKQISKNLKK